MNSDIVEGNQRNGIRMNSFRLVLLDYAKNQLENPLVQKILGDLIVVKQKNFERTDENYVVVDKHDMIGTHALVYDTSNLYEPKLIFAIRLTYEERALKHRLKTPLQELIPSLDNKCRERLIEYCNQHTQLIDCNSWFVDVNYSQKNSGLRLSDIGFVMVCLHLIRMKFDYMAGCTNEKYKAHRWLENIGGFSKEYTFTHPVVPDEHMLVLIEKFNLPYIQSVYRSNKALFDSLLEVTPKNANYSNIAETISTNFSEFTTAKISA